MTVEPTPLEQRMHRALKAAWPYVNRPFTSNSARTEVGTLAQATDIAGKRIPMLFALQTAWTFVHGSSDAALKAEVSELLRVASERDAR